MSHLLILAPTYHTFIKNQVEALADYWDQITVLVRYNPVHSLLDIFSLNKNQGLSKKNLVDYDEIPGNIRIILYRLAKFNEDTNGNVLGNSIGKHILRIIEKEEMKVDLIHSHFIYPMGYAGTFVSKELNVPNVITAHGYDVYDLPYRNNSMKNAIVQALNGSDHIITVSWKNVEYLSELNIDTPVSMIPNGFRDDLFLSSSGNQTSLRRELGLPLESKVLLSIGNLIEIKGHKFLLEALKLISEERDDVFCCIVGRGPLKERLRKYAKELDLDTICYLPGPQPHKEIPKWINACDLFVLPSLNEGNPTVMFEAIACGKPFIGSRVGGVSEIISSDEYGLLCEPKDPIELAEKILSGLKRKWDSKKVMEYSKNFTWKIQADKVNRIHQSLM